MLPGTWLAAALYHLIGRPVDARLRGTAGQVYIRQNYVGDRRLMRRQNSVRRSGPGSHAGTRVNRNSGPILVCSGRFSHCCLDVIITQR